MGNQGEIWYVSSFKGFFYWLWPLPHVSQNFEISLILFQNALKKLRLLQRTTSCPKFELTEKPNQPARLEFILWNYFILILMTLTVRQNIIHDEVLNISVLNAFLRLWTYKLQWHRVVSRLLNPWVLQNNLICVGFVCGCKWDLNAEIQRACMTTIAAGNFPCLSVSFHSCCSIRTAAFSALTQQSLMSTVHHFLYSCKYVFFTFILT